MTRWSKTTPNLEERQIFGDEDAAAMQAELEELTSTVAELSRQLHAQFTTIAAHAEIAREQSEFARDEARADLERTRAALIDLIEQVRQPRQPSSADDDGPAPAVDSRTDTLERRVDDIAGAVGNLTRRQHELTDMMLALLDSITGDARADSDLSLV